MCLSIVRWNDVVKKGRHLAPKRGRPTKREGVGWKVFRPATRGKGLRGPVYDDQPIRVGVWTVARGSGIRGVGTPVPSNYPAGFHIYRRRKDAEQHALRSPLYLVRKVLFRKAVAGGMQGAYPAVVAREMKVLPR